MRLVLTPQAKEDIAWWNRQDKSKTQRIQALIKNIMAAPFSGLGKPEPLRFDLQGYWSRRIDKVHRLVYVVENDTLTVVSCRYHYE